MFSPFIFIYLFIFFIIILFSLWHVQILVNISQIISTMMPFITAINGENIQGGVNFYRHVKCQKCAKNVCENHKSVTQRTDICRWCSVVCVEADVLCVPSKLSTVTGFSHGSSDPLNSPSRENRLPSPAETHLTKVFISGDSNTDSWLASYIQRKIS